MDGDGDIVGGGVIPQDGEKFEAVRSRQKEIQKNKIGPLSDHFLYALGAVAGKIQYVFGAETDYPLKVFLRLRIVVDHQQIGHGRFASISYFRSSKIREFGGRSRPSQNAQGGLCGN